MKNRKIIREKLKMGKKLKISDLTPVRPLRKMHPNSLANLHPPFKKGGNPNPLGRPPKDVSLTSLLKLAIERPVKDSPFPIQTLTWRQALVLSWMKRSLTDTVLFKELLDRLEGRLSQPLRISLDMRSEAERLAQETGLPVEAIIIEAEKVLKEGNRPG